MPRIVPQEPHEQRAGRPITFQPQWRKASRSLSADECVEAARLARDRIGIRDSKDATVPPLTLSAADWRTVITEIKCGYHDLS